MGFLIVPYTMHGMMEPHRGWCVGVLEAEVGNLFLFCAATVAAVAVGAFGAIPAPPLGGDGLQFLEFTAISPRLKETLGETPSNLSDPVDYLVFSLCHCFTCSGVPIRITARFRRRHPSSTNRLVRSRAKSRMFHVTRYAALPKKSIPEMLEIRNMPPGQASRRFEFPGDLVNLPDRGNNPRAVGLETSLSLTATRRSNG